MELKNSIREVMDFPKKGISFKDITPLLKDKEQFQYIVKTLAGQLKELNVDVVVGPEARGFLVGAPVAYELGVSFVPVRKPGKLPAETIKHEYQLEYGVDALEIHRDAIQPGQRVAIVDDLLATGGTVLAAAKLIEALGGEVVSMNFLIELSFLNGRKTLEQYHIESLVQYDQE